MEIRETHGIMAGLAAGETVRFPATAYRECEIGPGVGEEAGHI